MRALLNQVVQCDKGWIILDFRNVNQENVFSRNADILGGLECSVQEGHAGEEGSGTRGAQLVFELCNRVGGASGTDNARESVNRMGEGDIVDLEAYVY